MSDWYYLKNRKPVPFGCDIITDEARYVKLFNRHFKSNRSIRRTYLGDYWISTIFLGLDHSYDGGEPVLFETMIFIKDDDDLHYCQRCHTHRQALKQHWVAVEVAKELREAQ